MEFTAYQKRTAAWTGIAVLTGIFVWLLAPVLTPFLVAAVLAYALNPLVTGCMPGSAARRRAGWR